jgi:hypothetical protein
VPEGHVSLLQPLRPEASFDEHPQRHGGRGHCVCS